MAKLKFLVVEDDLFYQTYVNDLLAESGADILNAPDGETGLAMAVAEKPDLIITDIEIPKTQGFVLFKKLRENNETKDIPVIMMSGKVEKALLERHSKLSVHAEGYLSKPFSGQVLIDMIREVIGEDFGFSEVTIAEDGDDLLPEREPPEEDSAPEISQFPAEGSAPGEGKGEITILVVDDSRYICDVTKDFLEELGVRVKIASDGETGYKLASDVIPDLVLLDVQMPGMNGFVVCEMLRKQEETRNVPIILMSAVVDDESFRRHSKLRYHADAYLQKPFMKSELHELVRRFTTLTETVSDDVESKTGFFVPTEDIVEFEGTDALPKPADQKLVEELGRIRAELKEAVSREERLEKDLESSQREKDQFERELYDLRKASEEREGGLEDKLTLVTQRFEEARAASEKLTEENRILNTRLEQNSAHLQRVQELEEKLKGTREELDARERENQDLRQNLSSVESASEMKTQVKELASRLEEAGASALELENRNRILKDELEELREKHLLHSARADEVSDRQDLLKAVESLKRDLSAATAAKEEIEEQAKALLQKREPSDDSLRLEEELGKEKQLNKELRARVEETEGIIKELEGLRLLLAEARSESDELKKQLVASQHQEDKTVPALEGELSQALERIEGLQREKEELAVSFKELDEGRSRIVELEKIVDALRLEGEESGKLAAAETQARMDLEGRIQALSEEKKLIENELGESRQRLSELESIENRITELENKIEAEKELRGLAEKEAETLREQARGAASTEEKLRELTDDNTDLRDALNQTRERIHELEREKADLLSGKEGEGLDGSVGTSDIAERLDQLEEALGKTVLEAQSILKEQQDRESALEESIDALMRSLQEERATHRKDREAWAAREGELKDAFEDALRESRRFISEEAERFYPMHIPRTRRPLEVVSRASRYGYAIAAAMAAFLLMAGGYFAATRMQPEPDQAVVASPAAQAPGVAPGLSGSKAFPEPWVPNSGPDDSYEELWRRNTVQSVSEDMMIQATLHTRDELVAAIKYTAGKEGWTRERTQKALTDLSNTYNLSGSYYITVYSKNLKGGYPGYADNFERHIVLRDHSGREVRAHLPAELENRKFITSRVSSAGKEMNPDFMYEVGLTVAFPRKELATEPVGLQLVLYDVGAVPMRVLTWDISRMGSFSEILTSWERSTG